MKTRILCFAIVAALLAIFSPGMQAGDKKDKKDDGFEMSKPGPEHKMLAKSEGTWNAAVKMWMDPEKSEPAQSKGVMKRKMIMDGRFLREKYAGSVFGKDFEGLGVIGYDQNKKKFIFSWVDNFENGIYLAEGTYDTGKKTLTFFGEETSPKGKMKTRDVLRFVSDDEQVFEMFRSPAPGKEFKVMEITYKRTKKEEKKPK